MILSGVVLTGDYGLSIPKDYSLSARGHIKLLAAMFLKAGYLDLYDAAHIDRTVALKFHLQRGEWHEREMLIVAIAFHGAIRPAYAGRKYTAEQSSLLVGRGRCYGSGIAILCGHVGCSDMCETEYAHSAKDGQHKSHTVRENNARRH